DAIPLNARIVAAADTFDAMSSTRSYRAKMPRAEVLAEIERSAGSQLDRDVAKALLSLDLSEFDRMIEEHAKLSTFGIAPSRHAEDAA
ncbi:MAG: HD domain-containing phosphohydrolase, partial [Planctomycetota bacterium]